MSHRDNVGERLAGNHRVHRVNLGDEQVGQANEADRRNVVLVRQVARRRRFSLGRHHVRHPPFQHDRVVRARHRLVRVNGKGDRDNASRQQVARQLERAGRRPVGRSNAKARPGRSTVDGRRVGDDHAHVRVRQLHRQLGASKDARGTLVGQRDRQDRRRRLARDDRRVGRASRSNDQRHLAHDVHLADRHGGRHGKRSRRRRGRRAGEGCLRVGTRVHLVQQLQRGRLPRAKVAHLPQGRRGVIVHHAVGRHRDDE
mmetsp:Transcript_5662/g.18383  ORF Transcript_5662/g.18383 Transcript_5662/m.18383 type:complete len:257 (+) Transcript_5662:883-1653(+)